MGTFARPLRGRAPDTVALHFLFGFLLAMHVRKSVLSVRSTLGFSGGPFAVAVPFLRFSFGFEGGNPYLFIFYAVELHLYLQLRLHLFSFNPRSDRTRCRRSGRSSEGDVKEGEKETGRGRRRRSQAQQNGQPENQTRCVTGTAK